MRSFTQRLALTLAVGGLSSLTAVAQQDPDIGYVYPAGGQQGSSFRVVVGGQFLAGTTEVLVSGRGVQAEVIDYDKPMPQKRVNEIRDAFNEIRRQIDAARRKGRLGPGGAVAMFNRLARERGLEEEDLRKFAEFQRNRTDPKRQLNPQLAETVTLQVTIAADAEPGMRELRLAMRAGVSNPINFCVGQLPEFSEEPQETALTDYLRRFRLTNETRRHVNQENRDIALPAVINGQVLPGEVDRWGFTARQGQRLVIAVQARELIPYLADAVPGWFQATLALYDAEGNELTYVDDFRFHPDPVAYYEIAKSGDYVLEVKDSIYRGREDFVYRITVGEVPFITGVFPLGGQVGETVEVELNGWNLPRKKETIEARETPGTHGVSTRNGNFVSNRLPFEIGTLPGRAEAEPNNTHHDSQSVQLSTIVDGRIDYPGDWDVFRMEGRAGDEIVAEVTARRLGSSLDSVLRLVDGTGKQLAWNDDHVDKAAGLTTHHADSLLSATLPTDGTYYLHCGDTQHKGSPAHAYRLRISKARPDFVLRAVPSSINARAGWIVPMTIYAVRKDGFDGDISVNLKNAPEGFQLTGGIIPAGQDKVQVTLTLPPNPTRRPVSLAMDGTGLINGQEIIRPAVPADDLMQAFLYRHLVPANDLKVAVSGPKRGANWSRVITRGPVKIPVGGTAEVRVIAPIAPNVGSVELELKDGPDGIGIEDLKPSKNGGSISFKADADKIQPGLKGNLIVDAFVERELKREGRPPVKRRYLAATLPAIPFEVVSE